MSDQEPTPSAVPTIAIVGATVLIAASLFLPVLSDSISTGMAIAIGVGLSVPLLLLSMRRDRPVGQKSKRFLATRTEGWGLVGFITFFACVLVPIAIVFAVASSMPSGDDWKIVIVRLMFVVLAGCAIVWWSKFAISTIPEWFRGKVSDKTLDAFTQEEPTEKPVTAMAAALKNWKFALIAVTAFCVAFGVIDFNSPWLDALDVDSGSGRVRKLAVLVASCRENPNTVAALSVLVGISALALYVVRVRRAHKAGQTRR